VLKTKAAALVNPPFVKGVGGFYAAVRKGKEKIVLYPDSESFINSSM
jgi:hypothetical protein